MHHRDIARDRSGLSVLPRRDRSSSASTSVRTGGSPCGRVRGRASGAVRGWGAARRGCACSTLGLWSDGRGRVPRIVDDAGRRGVRERRRVLAHGSRGRVRPGSGRTGARRMGEVVVRGVRPGSGGTGPRTAPHASRHRPSTGLGRDGDRGMPWGCVPVHGLCPRCRTDLGAEPDRLSSRNPTDLGAEPNRSRCGWLSASQGDDAVCTGPGLMGSR